MSYFKKLIALTMMSLCFNAFANQGETRMEAKKSLVIGYDFRIDKVLKESTAHLHKNSDTSFHGSEKNVEVVLLGEKEKIIISDISETFLYIPKYFRNLELYIMPRENWSSLPVLIKQINQTKEILEPIKKIAIKTEEMDLNKLNDKYFENKLGEVISKYELEHTNIFFIMKKLDTPKEIHPRDKEYFRLIIRIDNKNI